MLLGQPHWSSLGVPDRRGGGKEKGRDYMASYTLWKEFSKENKNLQIKGILSIMSLLVVVILTLGKAAAADIRMC